MNSICIFEVLGRRKDDRPLIKAREGESITLSCDRGSVTTDTLYAVKWFKDEKEFYRNYPKAANPVKVEQVDGFTLEVRKNNRYIKMNQFLSAASI